MLKTSLSKASPESVTHSVTDNTSLSCLIVVVFWFHLSIGQHSLGTNVGFFLTQIRESPIQVTLIDDSKFPIGVDVSLNGCPSPCASPVTDCRPVQGVLHLCTPSWHRLQPPCTP